MNKTTVLSIFVMVISTIFTAMTFAEELKPIELVTPQVDVGKPLMKALKDRSSSRSFSQEKLSNQVLSNLLWAAFGINRPDSGKRTAPSARNWQEIDIYVAMADGLYLYEAKNHILKPVVSGDLRPMTGNQHFVKDAPVNLIYVADFSKMGDAAKDDKVLYSGADTGFISQNVYLYCASQGLATVVRGWVDRDECAKALNLGPDQYVTYAQTVGYPN